MGAIDSKDSRSSLERFLSVFANVRAGEGATALLLALDVFILLFAYYVIKTVREPLILAGGGFTLFGVKLSGAKLKSITAAGQAILLLGAVPLYAMLASRMPRRRLINIVTLFFVACLVAFYIFAQFEPLPLLFSIDTKFKSELDNETISEDFRQKFEVGLDSVSAEKQRKYGDKIVPLPDSNVKIERQKKGRVWLIIEIEADKNRKLYVAKIKGDQLKIYLPKFAILGVVFFLWVGVFNLMVIAQFWSFAIDLYTPEAGKRLFAIVAFGASAGAVAGSYIAKTLISPLGLYQLLLLAAGLLVLTILFANIIDSRERHNAAARAAARAVEEEEPIGKGGAFRLVFKSRYLLLIALLMLFLNWVNTTGEYMLGEIVTQNAKDIVAEGKADGLSVGELIGQFYGSFFFWVNLAGLAIQLFLVSRILKYFGARVALLVLPVIAFGGYALLVFFPVLGVIHLAKTAENSTDYSLQNTVRNVLFLPLTREQKYKAKQATDTFFVRAGDVLSGILVVIVGTALAFEIRHFAMVNLVLVSVWIIIAIFIGRENRRLTADSE